MELGEKLKAIRMEKKMTLDEVAKKSSLTKSFISQIELNKTSPSITSLMKVASALEIRLTDLFREASPAEDVLVKKGKRDSYYNKKTQLTIELLSTCFPDQKMEPIYFSGEPGGKTDAITRVGQEFIYIFKGKIKLILDQKGYVAEEGDSLYFDSSIPHSWENPWSEAVEGIWVGTPPMI
jgi:transcriptional regulator with XRE-family HTH domain